MVPDMLLIRLMQERLKEEDCVRRVRSCVWSWVVGAGGLQGAGLCHQMKEGQRSGPRVHVPEQR